MVGCTLGWQPGCSCYGLTLIGEQPTEPVKKKDETEVAFAARLALYQVRLDNWWRLWNTLKPEYDRCETVPCAVLDPFLGSGTTAAVALQLGRRAVGIELKPDYLALAVDRIRRAVAPATAVLGEEDAAPLFVRPVELAQGDDV